MIRVRLREKPPPRFIAALRWSSLTLLMIAPGCDLPGRPKAADQPIPADQIVDFDQLYRQNCAGCHGAEGKLGPAPPLNDALFLAIVPDSVLLEVISKGRSGTPMPAFAATQGGALTDAQVNALAAGLKARWHVTQTPDRSNPPYAVAKGSATGDEGRGAKVFARACASCHGPTGLGNATDDHGPGAINDRAFLALISDQALRRYAITGRPDLGMPDYADKTGRSHDYQPMTSDEMIDLVAYLASWRQVDRIRSSGRP